MSKNINLPRRQLLATSLALGGLTIAAPLRAALPGWTPNQVMGPFYPIDKPLDQDADLTMIAGKSGRAEGQVLHLMGRVVDSAGQPIPGARIEIWQANTHGRYPRGRHCLVRIEHRCDRGSQRMT